ncbi:MAG: type I-B CRISPR-associated endonuclease Cas1 [Ignavibacteria bacterium]|jgi:CRISPR-associated protein Cas1|nr:type I-B CRISPR-associated endonuclease Cas1 [Ignavibacteria bacterium]MCU7518522.1 type I-B CRISPR-associated endonuclease Cas1 [Ignavibacteria bacterium]MCU7526504.1 type I-B CRISPR-associated endonuclease Cas1 [Ignavibacteria bacterium]
MKRNYYIFSSGKLIRRQNTLYFEPGEAQEPEENQETDELQVEDNSVGEEEEKDEPRPMPRRPIPIEDIEAIYCFSEMRFNTKFLNFISQKQITLHLFNYYGYYSGSFYPREPFVSGKLLVSQVGKYSDPSSRLEIARKFVQGASDNILKNLMYYNSRDKDTSFFIDSIKEMQSALPECSDINELMGIEGNVRSLYYKSWPLLLDSEMEFGKREKHPPTNPINALISFGNSLLYTTVLSEIYKTQLNPLVSFLHEPGERRFSLSLDIAEIFKPLLSDRIIFSLVNKKQIQEKHFTKELKFCHLNEEGRKIYLKEYDERLKTTIQHRNLKRQVSYRHLIRLECYKLIKQILGEKEYTPFKIWW